MDTGTIEVLGIIASVVLSAAGAAGLIWHRVGKLEGKIENGLTKAVKDLADDFEDHCKDKTAHGIKPRRATRSRVVAK